MIEVSVRDLRMNLSRYLRELESGQSIAITKRGKPVGVISPLVETEEQRIDRKMRELVARGVAQWSGGKPKGLDPPIKLRGKGPTVSEMVIEDRR